MSKKLYTKRQKFQLVTKSSRPSNSVKTKKTKNTLPICYNINMNTKPVLLALDLSTTASGWAMFDLKTKKLIKYGVIKPTVAGLHKMKYPEAPLYRILDMSSKIRELIEKEMPEVVVIEETNRGINRISQKALDSLHFFVLDHIRSINDEYIKAIHYIDSNGPKGWRGILGLKLSDSDKKANVQARKNKKLGLPIVNWKTLAVRYVNSKFKMNLDESTQDDIADAIAIGHAYLLNK